jgi:membrane protease YdiL (CAAX protease family)
VSFRRTVFFLAPVLFLAVSIASQVLVSYISNDWARILTYATLGIVISLIFAMIIRRLGDWAKIEIQTPEFYFPVAAKKFALGIGIGLWISIVSGFAFAQFENFPINWELFSQGIPVRIVASVSPATTEEVIFRYGIVQGANALAGVGVAAAAGSIPFGLIHLVNNLIGHEISLLQSLGVVIGGLLLTLLYLRFGLLTAIACHLAWNSLASAWVDALSLPKGPGMAMFEGAWSTSLVLLVGCLLLFFIPKPGANRERIFS